MFYANWYNNLKVLHQIKSLASRQNTTISNVNATYMDVIDTTGPGVFSSSVYKGLSIASGTNVTSRNFTYMTSPTLVGDVLILPVTAFGPGIGHSGSGSVNDDMALVVHQFAGSWKHDHPMRNAGPSP